MSEEEKPPEAGDSLFPETGFKAPPTWLLLDGGRGGLMRTDGGINQLVVDRDQAKKKRKAKAATIRVAPPVPETGWKRPDHFPDLSTAELISVDTETHDPGLAQDKAPAVRSGGFITGVAIAVDGWKGYFPIRHKDSNNFDPQQVFDWLKVELTRSNQPKVFANAIYDLDYLAEEDVHCVGPFYDIQIAEPLIDENAKRYNLDALAQKYTGEGKITETLEAWAAAAFGPKWKSHMAEIPATLVGPYAEGDVTKPLEIFRKQKEVLFQYELWDLFMLETRLIPLLLEMRRRGVPVDLDAAEQLGSELLIARDESIEELHRLTGYRPAIYEAESIATMFDKIGIAYPRTEKTKKPSITKDWLEGLAHPAGKLLRRARKAETFKNTFIDGHILGNVVKGRLHTQFHQLKGDDNGTVSGRFSSSDPNLQNIPTRDKVFGPKLRSLFVPESKEHDWWSRDWSQIEYRILAHFASILDLPGAQEVVDAYVNDPTTDFHQLVAELTGLGRPDAKNFNFGMVYGQGIKKIAATLGCTLEEAKRIAEIYHGRAPYVKALSKKVTNQADKKGFIRTLLGRHRRYNIWEQYIDGAPQYFSEQNEEGTRHRAYTYAALNGLIQGSAADLMKQAMVLQYEAGVWKDLGVPYLTVHDELDGSILRGDPQQERALKEATEIMEHCIELRVPIRADGAQGINWAKAK